MFLGIDTSNYTTSLALFDGKRVIQKKKLLEVKSGERGLRQSDAVFQHTVNMPELLDGVSLENIEAVGVSTRPRNVDGSYMPCFLVGRGIAKAVSKTACCTMHETSHQIGHILAALYSADRLELIKEKHIAFHLSGGTTEALLVTPDGENIINAELIASSLDLKAGQLIDRTGVLLGLRFPCGKELDRLSLESEREFRIKPSMKGCDCSLSGGENKVKKMLSEGECKEDISKFALSFVISAVHSMLDEIYKKYGRLPVIFSGGVSSNSMLRKSFDGFDSVYFAESEFSLDNAAGVAIYSYLKENQNAG